jgi:hypothetical protein
MPCASRERWRDRNIVGDELADRTTFASLLFRSSSILICKLEKLLNDLILGCEGSAKIKSNWQILVC